MKIRALSLSTESEDWRPLAEELFNISSLKLGIRDPLSKIENQVLRKFLKAKFPDFTQEEISIAFDMYCARELEIDYTKNGHYNKMSADFVGLVLNAYREWRSEQLRKYKPVKKEDSQRDELEYYRTDFIRKFDELKQGQYNFSQQEAYLIYDNLWQLIEKDFTDEEIKQYKIQASIDYPMQKRESILQRVESKEDYKRRIVRIAKSRCFEDWIKGKALEDVNICELIQPYVDKFNV